MIYRHGDVNLIQITKEEFEAIQGKHPQHGTQWVLARGEATGSKHVLTMERTQDVIIKEDKQGRMYFQLTNPGVVTHTHDHETITVQPGFYVQVPEREVDHFANSVVRKVVD